MNPETLPSFGRVVQYLTGLGFHARPMKPGMVAYSHPDSGAVFFLRERDPDAPAKGSELYEMKTQLTYRGVVTDEDFDRFVKEAVQPVR